MDNKLSPERPQGCHPKGWQVAKAIAGESFLLDIKLSINIKNMPDINLKIIWMFIKKRWLFYTLLSLGAYYNFGFIAAINSVGALLTIDLVCEAF